MKIIKKQLRRIIREEKQKLLNEVARNYSGVSEEHFVNALANTWDAIRADVLPMMGGTMHYIEIGEEVMAMMHAYEREMGELFDRLSEEEQDELFKKAFGPGSSY